MNSRIYLSLAICFIFLCSSAHANVPNYWGKVEYYPSKDKKEQESTSWMKRIGARMLGRLFATFYVSPTASGGIRFHQTRPVFLATAKCRFRLYKKDITDGQITKVGKIVSCTRDASRYVLASFPLRTPPNNLPFEKDIEVTFCGHDVSLRFVSRQEKPSVNNDGVR